MDAAATVSGVPDSSSSFLSSFSTVSPPAASGTPCVGLTDMAECDRDTSR